MPGTVLSPVHIAVDKTDKKGNMYDMLEDKNTMGENKMNPGRKLGSISICVCFREGKA